MIRIGFYICHCGINIAYRVRVEEVAAFASTIKKRGGGAGLQIYVFGSGPGDD